MKHAARGFTLLEAVLVISMTGVIAAIIAVFVKAPVNAYVDQARRAELSDTADNALRRIAREVQRALPNSVRVDATGTILEFLPVSAGGRYRAAPDATGGGDFLDFNSTTDGSFSVLGPTVAVAAGDQLVVYNLGLPGADAYSGESRRALTSTGSALSTLTYTVGGTQFPFASPSNRFQIVNTPVTFYCAPVAGGSGTLRRYGGYAIQSSQPINASGAPLSTLTGNNNALLAANVDTCSFVYNSSASARNGLLTLTLKITSGGESVTLMHQVHLDNSP
ncbi:PulJ/GspJ family protein [Piscinibacter terrae]|uniref:Type II secretion system protein n=1 Tax=Piscinibacter terrae TaxID=2496871 RepID=A0A3N7HVD4_9BURK|nr:type II secretion system protein [Albitalea terrae]RQP25316.1 type II secretion system protein [Albitalea terrae]